MNSLRHKAIGLTILSFSFTHLILGQQDGGGNSGGESSAEASVTTSSSKKSAAAPETIESNPVVNIVKAGLPIQSALTMTFKAERSIAVLLSQKLLGSKKF